MNKQELINKLKKLLTTPSEIEGYDFDFDDGYDFGIERAISLAKDLDDPVRPPEPKPLEIGKPVVPQFVADWYEDNKDDFERNLYNFFLLFHEGRLQIDLDDWFTNNSNKPIETLVKMKLFGYEVEKEKLYLASFRDTDQYLGWNEKLGEWFMSCTPFTSGVKQTQETWEGVGIWNNPAFRITELEE